MRGLVLRLLLGRGRVQIRDNLDGFVFGQDVAMVGMADFAEIIGHCKMRVARVYRDLLPDIWLNARADICVCVLAGNGPICHLCAVKLGRGVTDAKVAFGGFLCRHSVNRR